MAKKSKRDCGCPAKLRRCHHELKTSLAESVSKRTAGERRAINEYKKRAEDEDKAREEVPFYVRFVQGGSPGSGKRR